MSNPTLAKSPEQSKTDTRTLVCLAMLSVLAYAVMWMSKALPSVNGFLDFDFKHVVICIGGFIFGPLSAAAVTVVVALIEMFTVGNSGPVGFVMNVLGTASFCCTASFVYRRVHTKRGAVTGLLLGMCVTTVVMLLWNYIMIPLYNGVPREKVAEMLLPVILPFNLAKSGLNTAGTLLLYKPVVTALRRAHLAPPSEGSGERTSSAGLILLALFILATCVLTALVLYKVI